MLLLRERLRLLCERMLRRWRRQQHRSLVLATSAGTAAIGHTLLVRNLAVCNKARSIKYTAVHKEELPDRALKSVNRVKTCN